MFAKTSPDPVRILSNWHCHVQRGDAFDIATLMCSALIGHGFDAYVVNGRVHQHVALNNHSQHPCPQCQPDTAAMLQESENSASAQASLNKPGELQTDTPHTPCSAARETGSEIPCKGEGAELSSQPGEGEGEGSLPKPASTAQGSPLEGCIAAEGESRELQPVPSEGVRKGSKYASPLSTTVVQSNDPTTARDYILQEAPTMSSGGSEKQPPQPEAGSAGVSDPNLPVSKPGSVHAWVWVRANRKVGLPPFRRVSSRVFVSAIACRLYLPREVSHRLLVSEWVCQKHCAIPDGQMHGKSQTPVMRQKNITADRLESSL